jgi:hypothetical protein
MVFPVVYFYLISRWDQLFARYALPAVPFMVLWGGIAALGIVRRLERAGLPRILRTGAVLALIAAAILPPVIGSVQWVRAHGAESTQAQAWKWITLNIWANAAVVSEARGFDLPAERYRFEFVRQLTDRDPEALAAAGVEWVILSSDAWKNRSAADMSRLGPPPQYAALLARYQVMTVITPTPDVAGPAIHILRLPRR